MIAPEVLGTIVCCTFTCELHLNELEIRELGDTAHGLEEGEGWFEVLRPSAICSGFVKCPDSRLGYEWKTA